jgi:hypothetical protein
MKSCNDYDLFRLFSSAYFTAYHKINIMEV